MLFGRVGKRKGVQRWKPSRLENKWVDKSIYIGWGSNPQTLDLKASLLLLYHEGLQKVTYYYLIVLTVFSNVFSSVFAWNILFLVGLVTKICFSRRKHLMKTVTNNKPSSKTSVPEKNNNLNSTCFLLALSYALVCVTTQYIEKWN